MSKRVNEEDNEDVFNYERLTKSVADFTKEYEERSYAAAARREREKFKQFFEIRDIITLCIQQNEEVLNLRIPVPLPLNEIPVEVRNAFERQKWEFDRVGVNGTYSSFYYTIKRK
jgi:hypothetical protein